MIEERVGVADEEVEGVRPLLTAMGVRGPLRRDGVCSIDASLGVERRASTRAAGESAASR